jgi:glycosyltransferase involved in cell wall biosynthesis
VPEEGSRAGQPFAWGQKSLFPDVGAAILTRRMKIALIHYSSWPEMGGVENVIRDQANMFVAAGHEVRVITGIGEDPKEGYEVRLVPEMAPDYPHNKAVRAVLERGQMDQGFNFYRSKLIDALDAALAGVDLTIVHNIFTVHFNLPLTRALHDLAPRHKMIAWTHDLTVTNPDYTLPNPNQMPWNLMRTPSKEVIYVATSDLRAAELKIHLKFGATPQIIPNMVDPARLFGCTADVRKALLALEIPWRDFVFLLPARVLVRKNIEFAIEVVKELIALGRNPLLLITAAKGRDTAAAEHYSAFMRQTIPEELERHIIFVSDFFPTTDEVMRDLYLLSDCVFFPSRSEGFGLPILEAAMHRMPVWCQEIPAFRALEGADTFVFKDIAQLEEAVDWLEQQPAFRQQRRCRRLFDPIIIYSRYYDTFLNSIPIRKS